jgi:hypothetical protein
MNDDVKKVREMWGFMLRAIGEYMNLDESPESYSNAYSFMIESTGMISFKKEIVDKADTCMISGTKLRKNKCFKFTYIYQNGETVSRNLSETWANFFHHWALILLIEKILSDGALLEIKREQERNPGVEYNLYAKTAFGCSNELMKKSLELFRVPFKYFFNFLSTSYQDVLLSKYSRQWFK